MDPLIKILNLKPQPLYLNTTLTSSRINPKTATRKTKILNLETTHKYKKHNKVLNIKPQSNPRTLKKQKQQNETLRP